MMTATTTPNFKGFSRAIMMSSSLFLQQAKPPISQELFKGGL